jgi:hypothetical protein
MADKVEAIDAERAEELPKRGRVILCARLGGRERARPAVARRVPRDHAQPVR